MALIIQAATLGDSSEQKANMIPFCLWSCERAQLR
jgi:hypothetical protein